MTLHSKGSKQDLTQRLNEMIADFKEFIRNGSTSPEGEYESYWQNKIDLAKNLKQFIKKSQEQ